MCDNKDGVEIEMKNTKTKKGGFGFDNSNLKGKSPFSHVNIKTTQLSMASDCYFGLARYFGMTVSND